jgi:4-hydroxy-tetrahydrodipicolinate synthase
MSIDLWKVRKDFSHLLGWAAKSAEALLAGSDGLVPSTGNVQPQLYADLYAASKNNDEVKAFSLQKISDELGNIYQSGRTLGESLWALKVLMKQAGLCETNVMPPIYEGDTDAGEKLSLAFDKILKSVR